MMKELNKTLVIDDDQSLCKVISYQLEQSGFDVMTATSGNEGLQKFRNNDIDIVVTDIQMPDISGIDVLEEIRHKNRDAIIILITAYGSVDNAIHACRLGADDYLTKPFGNEQLLFVIEKARRLRGLQRENQQLRHELIGRHAFENMIARSSEMEEVLKVAGRVAARDATVLILGESGTGKELLARAIHYNSNRKDRDLVTVNCPSIPSNLLESELFGHIKGAFTGALRDRKGKFESADKGTIFLDEIADLHEDLQAKLLRVLQEREIERVGESTPRKIDVRVIAATNSDLPGLIKKGRFREDLYYRLCVVPITIPPLRDRKDEIPFLVEHFIEKYGQGETFQVMPDFHAALQVYDWPGNIRELENIVERAIVLSTDRVLTREGLPGQFHQPGSENADRMDTIPESGISLEDTERRLIRATLKKTNGNRSHAARLLKIPRHVLLYRLKKFGMEEGDK